MYEVQLTEQAYRNLERRARLYGFESVEEYLIDDATKEPVVLDKETTLLVMEGLAAAKDGRIVSLKQGQANLKEHRRKWLESQKPPA